MQYPWEAERPQNIHGRVMKLNTILWCNERKPKQELKNKKKRFVRSIQPTDRPIIAICSFSRRSTLRRIFIRNATRICIVPRASGWLLLNLQNLPQIEPRNGNRICLISTNVSATPIRENLFYVPLTTEELLLLGYTPFLIENTTLASSPHTPFQFCGEERNTVSTKFIGVHHIESK